MIISPFPVHSPQTQDACNAINGPAVYSEVRPLPYVVACAGQQVSEQLALVGYGSEDSGRRAALSECASCFPAGPIIDARPLIQHNLFTSAENRHGLSCRGMNANAAADGLSSSEQLRAAASEQLKIPL